MASALSPGRRTLGSLSRSPGQGGAPWEGVEGASSAGVGRGGTGLAAPVGTVGSRPPSHMFRACPLGPRGSRPLRLAFSAAGPAPAPSEAGAETGGVPLRPCCGLCLEPFPFTRRMFKHICVCRSSSPSWRQRESSGETPPPGEMPVVNPESAGAVDGRV